MSEPSDSLTVVVPAEDWRRGFDAVRGGRSLKPKKWKGGARAAVALAVVLDHEEAAGDDADIRALSAGEYGARQGTPRILKLLARHGVKATFFVGQTTARLYPGEVKAIAAAGHEIALLSPSLAPGLPDEERAAVGAAMETLVAAGGKPAGLRAGGPVSRHHVKTMRALGLAYDASLMGDDDPYELLDEGNPSGIVEIPAGAVRSDAAWFGHSVPDAVAEEAFDAFRRELEAAYDEGGLFTLHLHPRLIGLRSRIWVLEELLTIAKSLPKVWFATHADLAIHVKDKRGA